MQVAMLSFGIHGLHGKRNWAHLKLSWSFSSISDSDDEERSLTLLKSWLLSWPPASERANQTQTTDEMIVIVTIAKVRPEKSKTG